MLSLDVSRQWHIHQLDVKNVFLHGHLTETVYMHQPPSFTDSTHLDYVCLLQKSLYGLKQAPHAWFQCFASYAIRVGFQHSKTDSSLFIYHRGVDTAYLLLYVDDIILTASFSGLLQCIISLLKGEFAMTDLGPLNYFLGISATLTHRSASGYWVFLGDNLFTWSSKCQDTLSRSGAEAEYHGIANAVAETSWLRNILRELHARLFTATLVFCDNVSAVYMSANPVQHQRTKHIEIDIHFVREKVSTYHVCVLHVPSRF
nr:copia protein [Tanacetum cinerariifolium]GEY68239.1 copia protein [Tanacetum cinerariifolium]